MRGSYLEPDPLVGPDSSGPAQQMVLQHRLWSVVCQCVSLALHALIILYSRIVAFQVYQP